MRGRAGLGCGRGCSRLVERGLRASPFLLAEAAQSTTEVRDRPTCAALEGGGVEIRGHPRLGPCVRATCILTVWTVDNDSRALVGQACR